MNLLIRFFYQIIKSIFSKKISVNDVDSCYMRVLPNDLDLNFHLKLEINKIKAYRLTFLSLLDGLRILY